MPVTIMLITGREGRALPIFEYKASTERHCEYCVAGFEALKKPGDQELGLCPRCEAPVRRTISAANVGRSGTELSTANIEKHGFTQYRKSGKGVYEKTAGKGPDVISDD